MKDLLEYVAEERAAIEKRIKNYTDYGYSPHLEPVVRALVDCRSRLNAIDGSLKSKRKDEERGFNYYCDRIVEQLRDVIKEHGLIEFFSPVHVPVLDNDGFYIEVGILYLQYDEDESHWSAVDKTGDEWFSGDFLPSVQKMLLEAIESNR